MTGTELLSGDTSLPGCAAVSITAQDKLYKESGVNLSGGNRCTTIEIGIASPLNRGMALLEMHWAKLSFVVL